jgi:lipopolysaccharide transport system ATP-binding protein
VGAAIVVTDLGKQYRRSHSDRAPTLKEALLRCLGGAFVARPGRQRPPSTAPGTFWALQDVNFQLAPGRMLGVIGRNGAGKSTLLRLLGGVGVPDTGSVRTSGRIGALLDLGAGFQPDLTGRENVYVRGVVAGLTRREVEDRFDDIVAFAEVPEAIDSPLRTYSTGMQMRLGFAIAVHTAPDILLIDEVLAVGDGVFQRKCTARIAEFRARGCAIVLVSHDVGQVARLCDEALWLQDGRVASHGPAEIVADAYESSMADQTRRRTPSDERVAIASNGAELRMNHNRLGSLELEITAVRMVNRRGQPAPEIASGDPLRVEIDYVAREAVPGPIFGITVQREDGVVCLDTSTESAGMSLPPVHGVGQVALTIERLDLNAGLYYLDVGAYQEGWGYAYDYQWRVYPLTVSPTGQAKGVLHAPMRWEVPTPPLLV